MKNVFKILAITQTCYLFMLPVICKAQTWNSVGTGMNSNVVGLAVYNGELYADGGFTIAGGNTANCIAQWNGTTWSAVGTATAGYCYAGPLAIYNGALYAPGGSSGMGKWNGTTWSDIGNGQGAPIAALCVYNGELYAGCVSTGIGYALIIKYNGIGWSYAGSGIGYSSGNYPWVAALAVYNGEIYAGGTFSIAGGSSANYITKWNDTTWSTVGTGMNGRVFALAVYNNELYAGGVFTTASGNSVKYIAKLDSTTSGIEKITNSSEIKIYPNPAKDILNVELKMLHENAEIKIVDVLGNEIISAKQKQVDVSNLQNGIYFVQVKTSEGILIKKIVIQH